MDVELILKPGYFLLQLAMSVPHIARSSPWGMLGLAIMLWQLRGRGGQNKKCSSVSEAA